MPTFPNPAGGSMNVANEAEARAQGWTPAMGSFGVNSYPTGGGGGGGGTTSIQPQVGSNQQDILSAFAAGSGFSIKDLEEKKRQFDIQQAFAREQMERFGVPQLEIQKRLADASVAFTNQQMALAQQNQRLQEAGVTGTYNGTPTEQARQFNQNLALQYLTQASQFAASDPFALSDFMRGSQQQSGVPAFIRNLQQGVSGAAAGNVGPNARGAITMNDLNQGMQGGDNRMQLESALPGQGAALGSPTGQLGPMAAGYQRGSGGINPQTGAALGAIGGIYQQGADKLGVGALEGMDDNELQTFTQGIAHLYGGRAAPAFLQAYMRSRPQQTAARTSFQAA